MADAIDDSGPTPAQVGPNAGALDDWDDADAARILAACDVPRLRTHAC